MNNQYVIRDNKTGKFVAYPGSPSSFTKNILDARKFPTKEIADKERCKESETTVSLASLLGS